jgi:ABC-type anion transport system duplicated permease subunit
MALLTMSAVILCFNTLIWRRLYGITSERYRLEVGQ